MADCERQELMASSRHGCRAFLLTAKQMAVSSARPVGSAGRYRRFSEYRIKTECQQLTVELPKGFTCCTTLSERSEASSDAVPKNQHTMSRPVNSTLSSVVVQQAKAKPKLPSYYLHNRDQV